MRALERDSLEEVGNRLEREGSMALLLVEVTSLRGVEVQHGPDRYDRIVRRILDAVESLEPRGVSSELLFFLDEEEHDSILLFLSTEGSGGAWTEDELFSLSVRLANELDAIFREFPVLREYPRLPIGSGRVLDKISWQRPGLVLELIRRSRPELERRETVEESLLGTLIASRDVETVFQPVVELATLSIVGFEALSRGPRDSPCQNPSVLFAYAERAALQTELERVCRHHAIAASRSVPSSRRLFLKILLTSFGDPDLSGERLLRRLEETGIEPGRLVLEISEKVAVEDYARLRERIHSVREIGVGIGLDNCGAGFGGLDLMVELRPHYMKLHRLLVANCHASSVKREMLATFLAMAEAVGCGVIAHGVEKSEELRCLRDLGIPLGQGFLLGRPGEIPLSADHV